MSTPDLELREEFPQLQIPTIRIITNPAIETPISASDDDGCHTPTSAEHKIPAVLSCPPAPKKRRRAPSYCKRKLRELVFFETVAREEVELFFVSVNSRFVLKRRCHRCT
ncbi:hypothetical protein Vadar_033900 [Vaccinium darrowii]|uniref:Uncharacterized protein n=1 Tax=Vaccinium darrowii TaxID=229202 RepID=A0ACB7YRR6_9ERIC|nr:hypothetical protein Vadar_033900 [Vaccinium darrowii]